MISSSASSSSASAAADGASITQSTYGDADFFTPAADGTWGLAVNDKVMLAGSAVAVKAAIDTGGKGTFDQNADVKAALSDLGDAYKAIGQLGTKPSAELQAKLAELAPKLSADSQKITAYITSKCT